MKNYARLVENKKNQIEKAKQQMDKMTERRDKYTLQFEKHAKMPMTEFVNYYEEQNSNGKFLSLTSALNGYAHATERSYAAMYRAYMFVHDYPMEIARKQKEVARLKKEMEKYQEEAVRAGYNEEKENHRKNSLKEMTDAAMPLLKPVVLKWLVKSNEEAKEFNRPFKEQLAELPIRAQYREERTKIRNRMRPEFTDEALQDIAESLVVNLVTSVYDKAGLVKSFSHLSIARGNKGAVLNGIVEGENGRFKVESIEAGGYNIQCYHIRTIVTKF